MTFTHPKDTNKQAVAPATASQAVGPPSGYASTCCTGSSVCKAFAESSCGGGVSLFSILEVCSDEERNMSSISITMSILSASLGTRFRVESRTKQNSFAC
jgi:hypothetical protein